MSKTMNFKDFPSEKKEIIEFLKANYNRNELAKLNNYHHFDNMYWTMKTYPNEERWVGYCEIVAKQNDDVERQWINDFMRDYSDNLTVMIIVYACMNNISEKEILDLIHYNDF